MQYNRRALFSQVVLCLLLSSIVLGQTPAPQPPASAPAPPAPPAPQAAPRPANFVNPLDVNVALGSDPRLFAVMTALNLAGYDYEPGGRPLSEVRARLRHELEPKVDPALLERLRSFYRAHRRPGADEPAQAAPYVALAFVLEEPPTLGLAVPEKALPEDVAAIAGFASLAGELYRRANLAELVTKYAPAFNTLAATYYQPVGQMIFQVLSYFHTTPVIFIPAPPAPPVVKDKRGNSTPVRRERDRNRRMFVITDPLSAQDTVVVRNDLVNMLGLKDFLDIKVGDDYLVVVGPSTQPGLSEIRRSFIRFLLDPIIERYAAELFDPKTRQRTPLANHILTLTGQVKTADPQLKDNLTLIVRESMVHAAEAGLARFSNRNPQERAVIDEENRYNLSRQYEQGAVLAFHFYDKFLGLEEAGIKFDDLYATFLRAIKFDLEAQRPESFAALRAKVEARRAAERERAASAIARSGLDQRTATSLIQVDSLIQQRQFDQARVVLTELQTAQPQNARVLYGLAQLTNLQPSPVELDATSDEEDKYVAQEQRLGQSVILYRQAIAAAHPERELWIKSRAHVAIGRIFDFFDKREAALAEYDAALKFGNVEGGAYKEALDGKAKPFQPGAVSTPKP